MRLLKTGIYVALGLLLFALQLWLVYPVPFWGLRSPFPYSILRSIEFPILLGVSGVVSALSAKSLAERRLFYSIVAASVAEIVTVKIMVWFSQPLLVLLVFIWNDFIAIQFLRYGELIFASRRVEKE
ncbi:hypothetical protein [Candidatus Binatus sp.]|uniref:hypothetical protein n=1 Tax=Candidatus Binatus sp. TaxID=2811406 RepID=UPI003C4B74DB